MKRHSSKFGVFANLKFRTKFLLSFATIITLLGASIGIGCVGLVKISSAVVDYQSIVAQLGAARDIEEYFSELQVQVRHYAFGGSPKEVAVAKKTETELETAIYRAKGTSMAPEDADRVADIEADFSKFSETIERLADIPRDELVAKMSKLLARFAAVKAQALEFAGSTGLAEFPAQQANAAALAEEFVAALDLFNSSLIARDDALSERIDQRLADLERKTSSLMPSGSNVSAPVEALRADTSTLRRTFGAYRQELASIAALQAELNGLSQTINAKADELKRHLLDRQQNMSKSMSDLLARTSVLLGISTVSALGISVLLALGLGLALSRPIAAMSSAMGRLATGDTEIALPGLGRKDEIGQMVEAVERFKAATIDRAMRDAAEEQHRQAEFTAARRSELVHLADQFERAVVHIADNVSNSSTDLEHAASGLSVLAQETKTRAHRASEASQQASADLQSVATATEELTASVAEIGRQVISSTRMADEAVGGAQEANKRMRQLAQVAGEIGQVVALIAEIASRTNLLALNATIEAARAGDHGKGFAVVAAEVKSLARRTADATDQISEQITGMQSATTEAAEAVRMIAATVDSMADVARIVSDAVEQQGIATQEIAASVHRVALCAHEVTTDMTGVTGDAADAGSASSNVLNSARALASESTSLQTELRFFMDQMRA